MKTLYISDLDGTLLSPNAELSPITIKDLNDLLEKGMLFSIATARSIASVRTILKEVSVTIPIILMNGVCIYDLSKNQYIKVEYLSEACKKDLLHTIKSNRLKGFAYAIKDGLMSTYYEDLNSEALRYFYEERVNLYKKPFLQVDDFTSLSNEPLIYFVLLDQKEKLEPLLSVIKEITGINFVFYKDNYTADLWYLEIFSEFASKYHAVEFLRSYIKPDKIVCFGDNRNDLPLFQASDYRCAVANAVEELKQKADEVIGSNKEDGVVMWLRENVL
jgi:Cof subfamily protein (haloacid dehalogenase superfamily)